MERDSITLQYLQDNQQYGEMLDELRFTEIYNDFKDGKDGITWNDIVSLFIRLDIDIFEGFSDGLPHGYLSNLVLPDRDIVVPKNIDLIAISKSKFKSLVIQNSGARVKLSHVDIVKPFNLPSNVPAFYINGGHFYEINIPASVKEINVLNINTNVDATLVLDGSMEKPPLFDKTWAKKILNDGNKKIKIRK